MSSFTYRPLQKGDIRLIEIQAGSALRCQLHHASIDNPPAYVALSYTWGAPVFSKAIPLDGQVFRVTKNLHEALHTLGSGYRDAGRFLWVDAICIDQGNIPERNKQVLLMTRIYAKATMVEAWLGRPSADSNLAFKTMTDFENHLHALTRFHNNDVVAALASISVYDRAVFGPPGSDVGRGWTAISALCHRDWWRRAWIVQEASGLQDFQIWSGGMGVPWSAVQATIFISMELAKYPGLEKMSNFDGGGALLLDGIRIRRQRGSRLELLSLLQAIRPYDCTDKKDKIYAVVGFASDVPPGGIMPDYAKSIEQIYTDVVQFCLTTPLTQRLDFLGYVMRSAEDSTRLLNVDESMPTWLPDWRARIAVEPLGKIITGGPSDGRRVYEACGDSEPVVALKGRQLHVTGFCTSRIIDVLAVADESIGSTIERSWTPENAADDYPLGGSIYEAFLHTLTVDVMRGMGTILHRDHAMDWSYEDRRSATLSGDENYKRRQVHVSMRNATFGRRLFWAEEGYMGLGPAAAKVGDKICVFHGGQVLYVLRARNENEHEFVGECYVHGLMDGEAVAMKMSLDLPDEKFVLI